MSTFRSGTEEQLNEAASYAKERVLSNPRQYMTIGDEAGKDTNDSGIGTDVVCMVAQYFAEGLGDWTKDGNMAHKLFDAAAANGSEWAQDALTHFKRKILGGWEFSV